MKKLVGFALLASPLAVFATDNTTVNVLIGRIQSVVVTLVPFVIGLTVLVIIWGLFNYIAGAGDEEKRGQAKQYIIWGVIGLFVMVSIWGLVGVVKNTLSISDSRFASPQVVPCPAELPIPSFNSATGVWTCTK